MFDYIVVCVDQTAGYIDYVLLLRVSFRQLLTLIMVYYIVACVVQTAGYIDYFYYNVACVVQTAGYIDYVYYNVLEHARCPLVQILIKFIFLIINL